jgi:hypothetical protein
LRDFTQEEIDEAKTNLVRKSGGDAALFFGSLRVLTGDFTGLIDVAGGSMANLANSGHIASQSLWIITVPKNEFSSKIEAANYMVEQINTAALDTLSEYGDIQFKPAANDEQHTTAQLTSGTHRGLTFGLLTKRVITSNLVQEVSINMGKGSESVYSYGVMKENLNTNDTLILPPSPLAYTVEVKPIDYDKFYKDFTSHLPEGFYVYTPSFPKAAYNGKIYSDRSVIVPAIYTQGKKYEFIKPEVK